MNQTSQNSDSNRIRMQMDGVRESAAELIRLAADGDESVQGKDMEDLIRWLRESEENQHEFDQVRKLDELLGQTILQAPPMEPAFVERLKVVVNSTDLGSGSEAEDDVDYSELFTDADADESAGQSEEKVELASQIAPVSSWRRVNWWIASGASVLTVMICMIVAGVFTPEPAAPASEYSAEMLCNDALAWNPNRDSETKWSSDLEQAPENRLFPNHLIRLQARSWKSMEIAGDQQGVVYNLIPEGNLSELKAFVYVFRSDKELDLPKQFASYPMANKKYRFWSVACQQDLVFVLVFEGDEKRLRELIKVQQVG